MIGRVPFICMLWQIKSPSPICHTIRHTCKFLFINKFKLAVTDVTDFCRKTSLLLPTKKAPVLSLKGRYLFWKALDLLKNVLVFWGGILDLSAMISHTYAFIVLYVCVAPCGMYVKKRAFWYEIRHNVHKFIVKWCGGLQKRNSWVQKWELFSILFIIPYLCRVFHADTSVREVWESGKYIYIEKTFTWRFVLGTLKLRKFLTLPQTKQQ